MRWNDSLCIGYFCTAGVPRGAELTLQRERFELRGWFDSGYDTVALNNSLAFTRENTVHWDSRWVQRRKRDRTGINGRTRAPIVTPPEVRLMRPSGVTRHPASGSTITFGKTFRFAEGKGPPTVCSLSLFSYLAYLTELGGITLLNAWYKLFKLLNISPKEKSKWCLYNDGE